MSCRQVEWDVVAHVGGIYAGSTLQQSFHQLGMSLLGDPVQWTEAMVVTKKRNNVLEMTGNITSFKLLNG